MIPTPNFVGVPLVERLEWARDHLPQQESKYCILSVDHDDDVGAEVAVTYADSRWLPCALNGGILLPEWANIEAKDENTSPERAYHLWRNVEPAKPMTEERAIEYLITTCLDKKIWSNYQESNYPKLRIIYKKDLPKTREFRNSWRIVQ
tara:strand:- start:5 stop:451 length:447 start_codon:yes stop_codon:yes gene_type:complete